MTLTRAYISEATGFDNGDQFTSEEQVRAYFTPENLAAMFGECAISQDELNAMAEAVIDNGWHMVQTWETVTPYGSLTIRREGDSWSAEVGSDADTQARLDEAEAEETGAGLRMFWEEVVRPVALEIEAAVYEVAAADGDYTIYLRIRDNEQTVYILVDSENASVTGSDPAPFPNYEPMR